jgi:hypothetical protein
MNASDILKYGHFTLLGSLDGLSDDQLAHGGVCGWWSTRDILAHLISYEHVLVEVLQGFVGGGDTPYLEKFQQGESFNDEQVSSRKDKSIAELRDEYNAAQAKTMELVARIPAETLRQPGTLPWYGADYALDDFIVYAFYGHKREHSAQINSFRDTLKNSSAS